MTREHVIPDFLYKQFPTQKLGYNARADKFMVGEIQTRDVCANCNNGELSKLDAYVKAFFSSIQVGTTHTSDASLSFRYDYALLLRWLLKVSFNASRAMSSPPALLSRTTDYILGRKVEAPMLAFLSVEVIRDEPIQSSERGVLASDQEAWTHIPTRMFRVGPCTMVRRSKAAIEFVEPCIRFVSINSWYFSLCLVSQDSKREERKLLQKEWIAGCSSAVILSAARSSATVSVSKRTLFDVYKAQALRVYPQWADYLSRGGQRANGRKDR